MTANKQRPVDGNVNHGGGDRNDGTMKLPKRPRQSKLKQRRPKQNPTKWRPKLQTQTRASPTANRESAGDGDDVGAAADPVDLRIQKKQSPLARTVSLKL
jgi:hypothetical protein